MKPTLKQLSEQWQDIVDGIRKFAKVNKDETREQKIARMSKLEANPEEWFKYYFPSYAYAEPAPFHKAATKRVLNNPEWYEVRMWSRELAKSTRTMMEVLYLILVGHPLPGNKRLMKKYVLFISATEDSAVRLLMPYKANLETNPLIINDYGLQEKPGKWTADDFTTRKGVAFRGLGIGGQPRGTRNEDVRPDVILIDDADTDQDCRNPEIITKNWNWIDGAALGTNSISKACTIIFCGNKIAVDCCVVRATQFADHTDIINIRDSKGRSSWPQKNTEELIARRLAKRSYAAVQREYYNNPIIEGSVFKKMAYKPARHINDYSVLICYTDPSFKDSKKNDYKATVLVGKWRDEFHVIKAYVEQTTTGDMIDWHYHIMDIVGAKSCYYMMEQVFLSELIMKEMYEAGKVRKRTIPISGDSRKKDDKFTRIESLLEPLHRNGKLYLNADEQDNPHMKRLEEQFLAFAPGSRAHDDGPDAVEGAIWVINSKEAVKAAGGITVYKRKPNSKRY